MIIFCEKGEKDDAAEYGRTRRKGRSEVPRMTKRMVICFPDHLLQKRRNDNLMGKVYGQKKKQLEEGEPNERMISEKGQRPIWGRKK